MKAFCLQCSGEFHAYPSRKGQSETSGKFCSRKCRSKYHADRKPQLTQVIREYLSYDEKTGALYWRKRAHGSHVTIGTRAGYPVDRGYRSITIFGEEYREHRLVWLWWHEKWPQDQIDHINRNKCDNRIANLREARNGQNRANSIANNGTKCGLKGVTSHPKWGRKFRAAITFRGKVRHIGMYDTAEEAHVAYCEEAQRLHGEFFRK